MCKGNFLGGRVLLGRRLLCNQGLVWGGAPEDEKAWQKMEFWHRLIPKSSIEHFFIANSIEDEDQEKSILLSVVGAATYSLKRNLQSPTNPREKTFTLLVALLNPKPSALFQRFDRGLIHVVESP